MGTLVRYVEKGDVEVLEKYLDKEGVTLIFPQAQKTAESLGMIDGTIDDDYDYGGEADIWADIVKHDEHHVFDHFRTKQAIGGTITKEQKTG